MKQAVGKLLIPVLMLAVAPAVAQEPVIEVAQEPVIEMVKVVTGTGQPADCLAPVAISRIDGVRRVVPASGFLIEPGIHAINGRVTLDTTKCGLEDGDLRGGSATDLVVDFETGKTYHIAYDHRSQHMAEWRLVVWKVEQLDQIQDPVQP